MTVSSFFLVSYMLLFFHFLFFNLDPILDHPQFFLSSDYPIMKYLSKNQKVFVSTLGNFGQRAEVGAIEVLNK